MLVVECAEIGGEADGAGGDQGIDESKAVGEMVGCELGLRAVAVGGGWPDNWERRGQLESVIDFLFVARILHQLHRNKARDRWQVRELREPDKCRRVAALDVDEYVGVQNILELGSLASLGFGSDLASALLAVRDVVTGADKAGLLPIGD